MSEPFSFRLIATDGAARRGEIVTPHGRVQTPAFMPVGTQGDREGAGARGGARDRRRDRARQYLSPDAAARRRAHRRARRPAQIHELAAADPDRFRRLPGDVAVGAAQARPSRASPSARISTAPWSSLSPERAIEIQALLGADISMQLDECLRLPASRDEIARAMQLSLRWGERSKRAFEGSAREGYALFGIVQGGDDVALREQSARALGRYRLRRLRHRRAGGRRAAGGHAQDRRGDRADAAGGAPALSDGRRHAARSAGSGRARHRHVRLRAADPQRPPRHGLHALRLDQSVQCAPRQRSAPARRAKRAPGGAHLFARLSASSDQGQRDARPGAALDHQSRLLPGADGRHARGDRGRAFCRFSAPPPWRNGSRAILPACPEGEAVLSRANRLAKGSL